MAPARDVGVGGNPDKVWIITECPYNDCPVHGNQWWPMFSVARAVAVGPDARPYVVQANGAI